MKLSARPRGLPTQPRPVERPSSSSHDVRAGLAKQCWQSVLEVTDDCPLAPSFEEVNRSFHFRSHAARREMPFLMIGLDLLEGNFAEIALVWLSKIDGDARNGREDEQFFDAEAFGNVGRGKILVDDRRNSSARPILAHNRNSATATCDYDRALPRKGIHQGQIANMFGLRRGDDMTPPTP